MESKLIPWLIRELDDRGWSHRELAKRAKVSQTTVSQVIAGNRQPTWDFCAKIALPLDQNVDSIFVLAGLKRPLPPAVKEEQEVLGIVRNLPPELRRTAANVLRSLVPPRDEHQRAGAYEEREGYDLPVTYQRPPELLRLSNTERELVETFRQASPGWQKFWLEEVRRIERIQELMAEEEEEEEDDDAAASQAA